MKLCIPIIRGNLRFYLIRKMRLNYLMYNVLYFLITLVFTDLNVIYFELL
jgi:hypothetical protein